MTATNHQVRHFTALGNVDQSILDWELDHGFEIVAIAGDQLGERVRRLLHGDRPVSLHAHMKLFRNYTRVLFPEKEGKFADMECYLVQNDEPIDPEEGVDASGLPPAVRRINNLRHDYLREAVRLARLFKKGNIERLFSYTYIPGEGVVGGSDVPHHVSGELFSLEQGEADDLTEFVRSRELPRGNRKLELAHDQYEESYRVQNAGMAFIAVATGLEVLIGQGRGKMSRNGAVLLGRGAEEADQVHDDLKNFHRKRSRIVHSGDSRQHLESGDLTQFRDYLRRTLVTMDDIGEDPDTIRKRLTRMGFGEGPTMLEGEA